MNSSVPSNAQIPELGFLIYDIGRLLRGHMMEKLCKVDLTEAQWRAVAHLTRMEGCRQAELAQSLQIRPITLARVIDKLEEAGLVRRQQQKDDRRAFSLYLTEEVKPLLVALDDLRDQLHEMALASLDNADRKHLVKMLRTIQTNLASSPALTDPEITPSE